MKLPLGKINALSLSLKNHSLFEKGIIKDLTSLHIFMEHHVFAVWDFMSLIKSLQHHICPSSNCWVPNDRIRSGSARLINEIILAEETDLDVDGVSAICHHDLYAQAMMEVGADADLIEKWVDAVTDSGFHFAIENTDVPKASAKFMESTFEFIDTGKPHIIAAAFAFGRETIIPHMFSKLANQLNISKIDCPKFHYYLSRHISLDGETHGPQSLALVEDLCSHDPKHIHEAEQAALKAIRARIKFWDEVERAIKEDSHLLKHS